MTFHIQIWDSMCGKLLYNFGKELHISHLEENAGEIKY
jgi:hypothetical protein